MSLRRHTMRRPSGVSAPPRPFFDPPWLDLSLRITLIKLTAAERADIVDVAHRGAKRCRDAILKVGLSDPDHKIEMHRELEEIAKMWESLTGSVLDLPAIDPPLSAPQQSKPIERSEIERTLDEK